MNWEHTVRVRYAECDRMGFVHHSVYALYFEEARTEILRDKGITYKEMEDAGIIMPVKAMHFEFIKAGRYDDLLTVKVQLDGDVNVRANFNYEIYNQHSELICKGRTEMFFVNKETLRPLRLPEKYKNLMS